MGDEGLVIWVLCDEVFQPALDAVDPSGYIYSPVNGKIIAGGSISVSGPGAVTLLQDGSSGQYSWITDGTAGTYTMIYSPPLGYIMIPHGQLQAPILTRLAAQVPHL